MKELVKKIKDKLFRSPFFKTIVFGLSVLVSGILCSSFVAELYYEGKLHWEIFYRTTTFYLILVYGFIIYMYNRFLYRAEKNILNFLDDNYCSAYIINACLPDLIEKYKKDLKEGKNPSEFIDIQYELGKLKK